MINLYVYFGQFIAKAIASLKKEFEKMAGGEEQLLKENGAVGRLATAEEMAEPIVFLNSNMARFVSGELMIVDMGKNSEIVLGFAKSRLYVPVALKLYNTKFMQDMFKKQISYYLLLDKINKQMDQYQ